MLRRIAQRSWRLRSRSGEGTSGGFGSGSEGIGRAIGDVESVDPLFLRCRGSSRFRFASSSSDGGSSDKGDDKWREIAIDRTGLVGGGGSGTIASSSSSSPPSSSAAPAAPGRSLAASIPVPPPVEDTPMTRHIKALIQFRGGPITVAEFMKESLTNPTAGYYTTRAKEEVEAKGKAEKAEGSDSKPSSSPGEKIFGPRGDFVTSPDISQLMGDCVGVWAATEWNGALGKPTKVRIVELGPGRGTLLSDALRALAPLSKRGLFASEVEVELVEVSAGLRRAQWSSLRCVSVDSGSSVPPEEPRRAISRLFDDGDGRSEAERGDGGIKVTWRSRLDDVPLSDSTELEAEGGKDAPARSPSPPPSPTPTLYVAHEFFDALPVHQFVRVSGPRPPRSRDGAPPPLRGAKGRGAVLPTSAAWRERLVDVADEGSPSPLRFVLSPGETPASRWLLPRRLDLMSRRERDLAPERLEVSGEAMAVAAALGERLSLGSSSDRPDATVGSALIIDYGRFSPPYGDSLVAIRGHVPVADVLSSAGTADLSSRVDFGALAAAAVDAGKRGGESSAVTFYGPISQSSFLRGLGIAARLESLVEAAEERWKERGGDGDDDDGFERTVECLVEGARRLVAPDSEGGLGDTYQAMVIAPAGRDEAPVPFGGRGRETL